MSLLSEQLKRDEGVKLHPYKDSMGKLTIGVGRNLDDVGISMDEAEMLLANDIQHAINSIDATFPWAMGLDSARKDALTNMAFNMGIGGLMGFRKFLAAMQSGDYNTAADEMLDSQWAKQVPNRAYRLSVQIRTGAYQ